MKTPEDWKEAFSSVYDHISDTEEYPIDIREALFINRNRRFSVIYEKNGSDAGNRVGTFEKFSFLFDKNVPEYSCIRETPIIADHLIGRLRTKTVVKLPTSFSNQSPITREEVKELTLDLFSRLSDIKTGISGEIIKHICVKLINISNLESNLISLEKTEENGDDIDFLIGVNDSNKSETEYMLSFSLKKKDSYTVEIKDYLDNKAISPEWLKDYTEAHELLLIKMYNESLFTLQMNTGLFR